jgi:hypothetical protein
MKTQVSLKEFSSNDTFNLKIWNLGGSVMAIYELDADELMLLKKQITECLKEWEQ